MRSPASKPAIIFRAILLLLLFPFSLFPQKTKLDSLIEIFHSDSVNASADLLNSIGSAYYVRYDLEGYNRALNFHQLALDAAKKKNDKSQIAVSYRLIAAVYDAINMNLDTAAVYYRNYLDYELDALDTPRIIDGYRNLLVINFKLKNAEEEMATADKLYPYLKIYKGKDNANFRNQLCIFYAQKRILPKAEEMFTEINADSSSRNNPENFRNYFYAKHFLLQAQNKPAEAIVFLKSMLAKTRLTADSISITKFLSEHYEDIGDYKNAFLALENNIAIAFRFANDGDRNKIALTASFYLNAQKEKERIYLKEKAETDRKNSNYLMAIMIILAAAVIIVTYFSIITRRQNAELKTQKNELYKLNDEKTLYLKEIHHRVKNNLQIISSMLDLRAQDISDEKTKDTLKEMQLRVFSIASVHKNLYERDDPGHILLRPYFENLFVTIYSTFNHQQKKISFTCDADELTLNIDDAIALGLIVNELVTNSLKYAFTNKDKGEIILRISPLGNREFMFQYSDNGKGLGPGTDINNINSFGIKLVRLMIKKLKSKLNIENQATGLSFFFIFKIEETDNG